MKIWIDCQCPCDSQFFRPLIKRLGENHEILVTSQDYAETVGLLDQFNIDHTTLGRRGSPKGSGKKIILTFKRTIELALKIPKFDVALGMGNLHSVMVSSLRKRPYINFMDNEMGLKGISTRTLIEVVIVKLQVYGSRAIVCPKVFPRKNLLLEGVSSDVIYQFNGLKEEVYLADFRPNPHFLNLIPFSKFVSVRPETGAIYAKSNTIVPDLLQSFDRLGVNVVYLPRNEIENAYAEGRNVFIPKQTMNGLDLCWYSRVTLTGSGTMGREASCMGLPAVSFYPGLLLLHVDRYLLFNNKMYHSRNINDIAQYTFSKYNDNPLPDVSQCLNAQLEVLEIVNYLIASRSK